MILAFDLALNHMGWAALTEHGDQTVVAVRSPFGADVPMGRRLYWLKKQMDHAFGYMGQVPFELWKEGAVQFSQQALKVIPVHAVLDLVAWDRAMVPNEVSPDTIKVLATNKGRADKSMMIEAAQLHLGLERESHWTLPMLGDAADALWVADYAARLYGWDRPELPGANLRAFK